MKYGIVGREAFWGVHLQVVRAKEISIEGHCFPFLNACCNSFSSVSAVAITSILFLGFFSSCSGGGVVITFSGFPVARFAIYFRSL